MKNALSIHRLLLERQTAHEIVRLPRLITSGDDLPDVLGLPPDRCLCTRLYSGRTSRTSRVGAMIVMAGTWPSLATVAWALDVMTVVYAPDDLVNEVTDYPADLVSPLMLPDDLTMLVDERTAGLDGVVYTPTGESCTALGIHTLDLFALCGAKPVPRPRPD